jgi:hypothetical protein
MEGQQQSGRMQLLRTPCMQLFILMLLLLLSEAGAAPEASKINKTLMHERLPDLRRLQQERARGREQARQAIHDAATIQDTYLAICTIVRDDADLLYEWIM